MNDLKYTAVDAIHEVRINNKMPVGLVWYWVYSRNMMTLFNCAIVFDDDKSLTELLEIENTVGFKFYATSPEGKAFSELVNE